MFTLVNYGNFISWSLGETTTSFTVHNEHEKEMVDIKTVVATGAGKTNSTKIGNQTCWDTRAMGKGNESAVTITRFNFKRI